MQNNRSNPEMLFIGLYRSNSAVNSSSWTFDTYVGPKDAVIPKLAINLFKPNLVDMVPVLAQWHESMQNHVDSNKLQIADLAHLGRIGIYKRFFLGYRLCAATFCL